MNWEQREAVGLWGEGGRGRGGKLKFHACFCGPHCHVRGRIIRSSCLPAYTATIAEHACERQQLHCLSPGTYYLA